MSTILVAGAFLLALGVFAATWIVNVALWRGFRDQWRRFVPDRRRRGVIAGGLTLIAIVIASALMITAPWGQDSVLFVMAAGFAIGIVIVSVGVVGGAIENRRRLQHKGDQAPWP